LVFKFYSTFYFNRSANTIDTPHAVNFRLLGVHYNLSISEFNVALGFVKEDYLATDDYYDSFLDIPPNFDANEALALLTEMRQISYDPKRCKDIGIHSPALQYIHRFLAFNFLGRNDASASLTRTELFFLWCMHSGKKVNLGYWFAIQFQHVLRSNWPLILGTYITRLASNLNPSAVNFSSLNLAYKTDSLDTYCLDSMGLLAGTPSSFYFVPPGTRTDRSYIVFRRRHQHGPEPPNFVESRLTQIEEGLDSLRTLVTDVLTHLRDHPPRR